MRTRVHGSARDLRAELKAAKEARHTAAAHPPTHDVTSGDIEIALAAFRREATRRGIPSPMAHQEVVKLLQDTAGRMINAAYRRAGVPLRCDTSCALSSPGDPGVERQPSRRSRVTAGSRCDPAVRIKYVKAERGAQPVSAM